ncbi:MAG: ribonuclease G [Gammaproteobacteria bacterium]
MSDEILVNVTPSEARVAVVENGLLQEVYIERANKRGLVANIYKGSVCRILPGIQAAFIDIGLERTAFLHASDIYDSRTADIAENKKNGMPAITDLLREGEEILVQVIKDPLGAKGARLMTQISIPSRYVVFIPNNSHIGISQRIDDEGERQRLKNIVLNLCDGEVNNGYILRTAAEGVGESDIAEDIDFLHKLWGSIKSREKEVKAGEIVYEDLPLAMRILRDLPVDQIDKVRIDSRETYQKVQQFTEKFIPEISRCIEHYPGERPIFDLYSVDDEIQKALDRTVQLKSGGHICIDQTEAMTTIDVNTGAFVGHSNLEETIFKTNLEAAQAIARQLRLRNLGGIIIIDFIDMSEEEHKRQVLRALEKSLAADRAKSQISEVSSLGLVQMTRKRTRESLEHVLCEPCPTCARSGYIKTKETVCYEIFREILREARQFDAEQFLVLANQDIVNMLLEEESASMAALEKFIGKPVKVQVEKLYTQEQYDVVPM